MNFWIVIYFLPIVVGMKHLCPDESSKCPDSSTCCQLIDKTYGCCPLVNAVCCDDHIHCCPARFKCTAGMCIEDRNITMENNLLQGNDIICPDKWSTCPKDATCCKSSYGDNYNCCPLENAVCCNDGVHCCPSGTVCDIEKQQCVGDRFVTPMYDWNKQPTESPAAEAVKFSRISLVPKQVSSVVCPGSSIQCPDGYTCCKLPTGDWGCCPFSKATCCRDGLHCCPEHMHCDATSRYCSQGFENVTSLRNIPGKSIVADIICPDKSRCEIEDTCCKLNDVQFGCCHYPNATCCSDFLHCCPSNHACDVKHKRCIPKLNLADASENYVNYFGI